MWTNIWTLFNLARKGTDVAFNRKLFGWIYAMKSHSVFKWKGESCRDGMIANDNRKSFIFVHTKEKGIAGRFRSMHELWVSMCFCVFKWWKCTQAFFVKFVNFQILHNCKYYSSVKANNRTGFSRTYSTFSAQILKKSPPWFLRMQCPRFLKFYTWFYLIYSSIEFLNFFGQK